MEKFDRLIANGGMVCYNNLASKISHFKTGGSIDLLIKPRGREGLIAAFEILQGQDYELIGAFTNTLVGDGGVRGVLLSTKFADSSEIEGGKMHCDAGASLINIAKIARLNGLGGLEELSGIPGTVGGGVYMNCGAYGRYMSDIVESVEVWDGGKVERMAGQELQFGYRDSIFMHKRMPIISCTLKLVKCSKVSLNDKTKDYQSKRNRMQPEQLSLGCVFKKVGQESAGVYIERAGLKGASLGGVMVSAKHANFIVNSGGATASQYKQLVELCSGRVKQMFNIDLQREVIYLGED